MTIAKVSNRLHSVLSGAVIYTTPVVYENLEISKLTYRLCLQDSEQADPITMYNLCYVKCYGWKSVNRVGTTTKVRVKNHVTKLVISQEVRDILGWCVCDLYGVSVPIITQQWVRERLKSDAVNTLQVDEGVRSWLYYGPFFRDVVLDIDIDTVSGILVYVFADNVVQPARVIERLSLGDYAVRLESNRWRMVCTKSEMFSSLFAARAGISLATVKEK